ncbi:hypothetical protein THRCLA_06356 [Thraustotheca clavata]|uniref:Uncharacterized protein n=1 Tax=Thraustotheca clavata TaxID=74557 RepID=A0A1V9ZPH3_9STRA|nr:hypothetical protein THRCLA_06356 [Thraustotheca clavata]
MNEYKYDKRTYNRERQRMLQNERLMQVQNLKQQITLLQEQLQSQYMRPLKWKEIAQEIQDCEKESKLLQKTLRRKVNRLEQLIKIMTQWVADMMYVEKSLDNRNLDCKNITLMEEPLSRQLGCEWILDHLFYNMEYVFSNCGFPGPNSDEIFQRFQVTINENENCQYEWCTQRILPASFDDTTFAFQKILKDNYMGIGRRQPLENQLISTNTKCFDYSRQLFKHSNHVDWENWLCGEYFEPNRYVIVMQSIHNDAKHPSGTLQRNRMTWVVVDRIGPMLSRTRELMTFSNYWTKDTGNFSLEQEAKFWGCNLNNIPEYLWHTMFTTYMQRVGTCHAKRFTNELINAIKSRKNRKYPPAKPVDDS